MLYTYRGIHQHIKEAWAMHYFYSHKNESFRPSFMSNAWNAPEFSSSQGGQFRGQKIGKWSYGESPWAVSGMVCGCLGDVWECFGGLGTFWEWSGTFQKWPGKNMKLWWFGHHNFSIFPCWCMSAAARGCHTITIWLVELIFSALKE